MFGKNQVYRYSFYPTLLIFMFISYKRFYVDVNKIRENK